MEGIYLPLPHNHLNNDDFHSYILESQSDHAFNDSLSLDLSELDKMVFNQFNEYNALNFNNCPDNNFYNLYIDAVNQCNYVLPNEVDNILENNTFSCCHLNINSVPKHFQEFEIECLNNKYSFDVISLCETKLTSDIDHLYELNNYNRYNNNKTRNSGGIALYIE